MAQINNHDIAGLARRMSRFVDEMQKSVSSEVSQTNEFDVTRAKTYLNAIESYQSWVNAQPQLDLPETHPLRITVSDGPELIALENESTVDLVYLIHLARVELVNSQSARNGSGLIEFDSLRLTSVIQKAGKLITEYIEQVTPLDLPESSPMQEGAVPGRSGI
jgi:hypothetical protein